MRQILLLSSVLLFSISFSISAEPVSQNVLVPQKPDQSDWVNAWTKGLGCSIDSTPDAGRVLRQKLPLDFPGGNHGWAILIPIKASAHYRFKVLVRYQEISQAMAQFHFGLKDGRLLPYQKYRFSTESLSGTQENWRELTYEFTAPADVESLKLTLRLNSSGSIYWNKPELQELP